MRNMDKASCPFCNSHKFKIIKKWKYGKIDVSRHKCSCGESFNFFQGRESTWTIPKKKK